jgi:hypothetical protein
MAGPFFAQGYTPFALHDRVPVPEKSTPYTGLLRSACAYPTLSHAFFDPGNVHLVTRQTRAAAAKLVGHAVPTPSAERIEQDMHYVYVRFARSTSGDPAAQLALLNANTVELAAKGAANDAVSQKLYIRDASRMAIPMQLPVATTKRGENPVVFTRFM